MIKIMEDVNTLFERVKILSKELGSEFFLLKNPITKRYEIFTAIVKFSPANININNYNELEAREITNFLNEKWGSLFFYNKINIDFLLREIELLPVVIIKFPPNYNDYYILNY